MLGKVTIPFKRNSSEVRNLSNTNVIEKILSNDITILALALITTIASIIILFAIKVLKK
jgi:hypothetical protein